MGISSEHKEEGAKTRTVYLFYENDSSRNILNVFAIDSSSLAMYPVTKLRRRNADGMGYIAHQSKLYAIGGVFRRGCGQGYPRDVFVCDLSKKGREGALGGYKWTEGPALKSGKPNPMVVAVKGKIYALAGHGNYSDEPKVPEALDTAFEVLDHRAAWHPLPKPPFSSWYSTFPGPSLVCYTVVGNIIYVLVREPGDGNVELLCSFNVVKKKWKQHLRGVKCGDHVGDNLANHRWSKWADVVDGNMYLSDAEFGCFLYAHNCTTSKKKMLLDKMTNVVTETSVTPMTIEDDIREMIAFRSRRTHDGLRVYWKVDSYPDCYCDGVPFVDLPVRSMGLTISNKSLVAHVGNQMFLVVCTYNPPPKFPGSGRVVFTCLLKIVKVESNICKASCDQELRDCAVVVKHKYHIINSFFSSITAWSAM